MVIADSELGMRLIIKVFMIILSNWIDIDSFNKMGAMFVIEIIFIIINISKCIHLLKISAIKDLFKKYSYLYLQTNIHVYNFLK